MKKLILSLTCPIAMLPLAAPVSAADFGHAANPVSASAYEHSKGSDYRKHRNRDERLGANSRVWRDREGRYRCQRNDGTTGLLIGAAAGGVAGHVIAGRGDKTLGAILGAAGGAILGREIDRDKVRCR